MGSALSGLMGGGGSSGIFGALGGIVGGIFGGPLGAMIGQAVGGMVQDAVGGAVKDVVNDLQKEHGMPKFLADQVKDKVDSVIDGLKDKNVPKDARDIAQQHFGDAVKDLQKQLANELSQIVQKKLGDDATGSDDTKSKGSKSGKPAGNGWLQAIAAAMGSALGNKAAEMVELSEKMSALNETGDQLTKQLGKAKSDEDKAKYTSESQQNAREFNETMTQFQATSQEYNTLNGIFSTAIKTLGEALSAMARKQ